MPELPEVETIRRDLERLVKGARIERVRLLRKDRLLGAGVRKARRALEGATIIALDRRGKALMLRVSSGYSLIVHFRMTGQLYPISAGVALPEHTRTVFEVADGRRLAFVDMRRFGTLELIETERESEATTLANIGRDALTDPPAPAELQDILARRKCAIKSFLLDQKPVSGIGNIYASEVLARARIAPDTPCNELTREEVRRLLREMKKVLGQAIEARGTTISDYRTGSGETGGFQRLLRVYGREGERCRRRGCKGRIARMVQSGRSTYYCPVCQGLHAPELQKRHS